jgi:RNA polymerase sigma-70 factor (ECF subfamily)
MAQLETHRPVGEQADHGDFDRDMVEMMPVLRRFAFRFCKSPDEADDLLQETLMKALRYRDHFEPGTALKSWLFTIMRNSFLTQFKKTQREPAWDDEKLELLCSHAPDQDWVVYQHQVALAIDRLAPSFKSALAQVTSGHRYEDVAVMLNCETGTVKSRVSRARDQLKKQFPDIFEVI